MNIIEDVRNILKKYEDKRFNNHDGKIEVVKFLSYNGELIAKYDSYLGEEWVLHDNKIFKFKNKDTELYINIRRTISCDGTGIEEEFDFFEVIPKKNLLNNYDYERVNCR